MVLSCQINTSLGFVSSFNDKPVNEAAVGPIGRELFEKEQEDLLSDLKDVPKKACDRRVSSIFTSALQAKHIVRAWKANQVETYLISREFWWHCFLQINEFVKRARAAKIHAYIISHLKKEMPTMIGKAKTQQRLIDNLEEEFGKVPHLSPANNLENHPSRFTIHALIILNLG